MLSVIPDWITAICAIFGVVVAMCRVFNALRPDADLVVDRILSSQIYRITLYPRRIKHVYVLENIISSYPLYAQFKGVDILGNGMPELHGELSNTDLFRVIPANYQRIENEPFIEFYLNLKGYNKSVYPLFLQCSSEHFPFRWRKRVGVPKQV